MSCKGREDPFLIIRDAIGTTTLTLDQKSTLTARFLSLLREYRIRSFRYSCSFNTLRIIITVGSLIVPALLSVQYAAGNVNSSTANISTEVYWIVWNLSLFVTISNGVMTLMKVDKKYFTLNTTYEHLISEGWQFIQLSGKYSGFYTPAAVATHNNQFVFFCNMIEKIRMKQVEEEYYKIDQAHTNVSHPQGHDQLVPPTPALVGTATALKKSSVLPFIDENSSPIINEESDNATKIFFPDTPPASQAHATVRKKHPPSTKTVSTPEEGQGDEHS